MPRDKRGTPFGIDSIVKTPKGDTIQICGFIVLDHAITQAQAEAIAAAACEGHCDPGKATRVYPWHDVELDKPEEDPYRHHAHVDTCRMDVAQKEGLDATVDREKIQASALAMEFSADKWVWGG